jgi:hypothetical protein
MQGESESRGVVGSTLLKTMDEFIFDHFDTNSSFMTDNIGVCNSSAGNKGLESN